MKAYIITAPPLASQAGDDMLSGVVLHEIKAAIPIDGPVYTAADIQRAVTGVNHSPVPFMHLQNFDRAKGA